MLTPQEVSEHAFAKAGFGGYNMAMVDEFLDQLTEDYTTLYKENAALKGKMKVLVEKVEEYRSTEDAMRKTLLTAQRMADELVKEARESKEAILRQAEEEAKERVSSLRQEAEAERLRLTAAQNATTAYVSKLKELYQHELEYLGSLSKLTPEPAAPKEDTAAQVIQAAERVIQAQEEAAQPAEPAAAPQQQPAQPEEPQRPGGLYDDLTAARQQDHPAAGDEPEDDEPTKRLSIDLEHLQFGKDYEIR